MASATFRKPPADASRTAWPAGSWEAKWREPGKDGRLVWRNKKGFATRREALAYAKRVESDVDRGDHIPAKLSSARFGDVAAEWLGSKHFDKERTREGYQCLLDRQVPGWLKGTAVGKITNPMLGEWVKERVGAGVGAGTIRNAMRNVIKPSLDYAVQSGLVRANPALGVKLPRVVREEQCFLSAEEVELLAGELAAPYDLLVRFTAYTGLRAGEVEALQIKHLDLMRKTVHVKRSAMPVKSKGLVYVPTKTYAERVIPLPSFLVEPLMEYVAPRASEPEAFVFVARNGRPLHHSNFMARHFKPAVARLVEKGSLTREQSGLRFHDLRHTAAALMIDTGAEPIDVMKRMGHSSITVTYDRYGHRFADKDKVITSGLEAAHRRATTS